MKQALRVAISHLYAAISALNANDVPTAAKECEDAAGAIRKAIEDAKE